MTKNLNEDSIANFDFSAAEERIKDQYYADDEINLLIAAQIKPSVVLLPSSITVASTPSHDLTEKTNFHEALALFRDQKEANQLVSPINVNNHFTGLHVVRDENGKFHATYVDPMGTAQRAKGPVESIVENIWGFVASFITTAKDDGVTRDILGPLPHSSIPRHIIAALESELGIPASEIAITNNRLQHSNHAESNVPSLRNATNNHCGAFTTEILVALANGQMMVAENRLLEDDGSSFIEVLDHSEFQSQETGFKLRGRHAEILKKIKNKINDVTNDDDLSDREQVSNNQPLSFFNYVSNSINENVEALIENINHLNTTLPSFGHIAKLSTAYLLLSGSGVEAQGGGRTHKPTPLPTETPTQNPSINPTTSFQTFSPSVNPTTDSPTSLIPTLNPTSAVPSAAPTFATDSPTSLAPTQNPTSVAPSTAPTLATDSPTSLIPTQNPTSAIPSVAPTFATDSPTSSAPTQNPTSVAPSTAPTFATDSPTSLIPTLNPTSAIPSTAPTFATDSPTSSVPTQNPTSVAPSVALTLATDSPTSSTLTQHPSGSPTSSVPSATPTVETIYPTSNPSSAAPTAQINEGNVTVTIIPTEIIPAATGTILGTTVAATSSVGLIEASLETAAVTLAALGASVQVSTAVVSGGILLAGAAAGDVVGRSIGSIIGLESESAQKELVKRRLESKTELKTAADKKSKWPTQDDAAYLGRVGGGITAATLIAHHYGWKQKTDLAQLSPYLALALRDNRDFSDMRNSLSEMTEGRHLKRLRFALNAALLKLEEDSRDDDEPTSVANAKVIDNAVKNGKIHTLRNIFLHYADSAESVEALNSKIETAIGFSLNTILLPVRSAEYALLNKSLTRVKEDQQGDIELGRIRRSKSLSSLEEIKVDGDTLRIAKRRKSLPLGATLTKQPSVREPVPSPVANDLDSENYDFTPDTGSSSSSEIPYYSVVSPMVALIKSEKRNIPQIPKFKKKLPDSTVSNSNNQNDLPTADIPSVGSAITDSDEEAHQASADNNAIAAPVISTQETADATSSQTRPAEAVSAREVRSLRQHQLGGNGNELG